MPLPGHAGFFLLFFMYSLSWLKDEYSTTAPIISYKKAFLTGSAQLLRKGLYTCNFLYFLIAYSIKRFENVKTACKIIKKHL
ncbi:hypothetical protein DXB22_22685 [Clostridiaceae bacterium OM02-2AC]|nr:hypothetical protein DXB22_22685 [Clostridiaceae bacterium OM02-2AC]